METKSKAAKNLKWDEYRKLCQSYHKPTIFLYTGCTCLYNKEIKVKTFLGRDFIYKDCGDWCPRRKWWNKQHKVKNEALGKRNVVP